MLHVAHIFKMNGNNQRLPTVSCQVSQISVPDRIVSCSATITGKCASQLQYMASTTLNLMNRCSPPGEKNCPNTRYQQVRVCPLPPVFIGRSQMMVDLCRVSSPFDCRIRKATRRNHCVIAKEGDKKGALSRPGKRTRTF
jgi:hypothetical protein